MIVDHPSKIRRESVRYEAIPGKRGKTMLCLYVAGPYSADNVLDVLNNIRRGQRAATEALLAGFAPFCPWLDFHFQLMLRDNEQLQVEHYYAYSMAWLRVSDGVWIIEGWENSEGASAEVAEARRLGIPIFESLEEAKAVLIDSEDKNDD